MTTFSDFIESETHLFFSTTKHNVKVEYFKHPYMSKYCLVYVFSKTKTKTLDSLIIEKDLIADANSCTALLRVFKTVKAVKGNDFSHYMDELCYLYDDYLAKQSISTDVQKPTSESIEFLEIDIESLISPPARFSLDARLFFTPDELNIIEYCLSNYSQYFADNDDLDSVNDLLDKIQSFSFAPSCLELEGGNL